MRFCISAEKYLKYLFIPVKRYSTYIINNTKSMVYKKTANIKKKIK